MDETRAGRLPDDGPVGDCRGNGRGHPVGRIASFLLTGMLVVLAAIALLCWGPRLFGWTTFGVVSNSMAPSLWACDLAFVDQTVQPEAMGIGDVAVFHLADGKVCGHRIVEVDRQARTFTTKGDAVAIQDAAPVSFDRVIGQVKGSMAFAGAPLVAYQNHKWLCVGVLSVAVVLLFVVATALGPPRSAKRPSGEPGGRGWRLGSVRESGCERGV
ncbi:signal peptidase I [Adlercreutzia aquisgranensis]|uniref:signal peptidase I n=1 Tax=Adlercreutzia aquisgranensis TaxID=2941323 RepID=UPI00203DFBFC|nr:signal peptidase I [Adlercreutzia aquisgranensis]